MPVHFESPTRHLLALVIALSIVSMNAGVVRAAICVEGTQFCPGKNPQVCSDPQIAQLLQQGNGVLPVQQWLQIQDACCIEDTSLCLLEPVPGGVAVITPQMNNQGLGAFEYYINNGVWRWAFRIGVAIAVLNGVFGGFEIVTSDGDSGKVDAGRSRFLWSAIGLVILLLAGVILAFINPIGFSST